MNNTNKINDRDFNTVKLSSSYHMQCLLISPNIHLQKKTINEIEKYILKAPVNEMYMLLQSSLILNATSIMILI